MCWTAGKSEPRSDARTLTGTVFSIYLTLLEPFVIGATCAWCLASAVIMALLMLLGARLPRQVA